MNRCMKYLGTACVILFEKAFGIWRDVEWKNGKTLNSNDTTVCLSQHSPNIFFESLLIKFFIFLLAETILSHNLSN